MYLYRNPDLGFHVMAICTPNLKKYFDRIQLKHKHRKIKMTLKKLMLFGDRSYFKIEILDNDVAFGFSKINSLCLRSQIEFLCDNDLC